VLTPFALLPSSKLRMRRACVLEKPIRQTEFNSGCVGLARRERFEPQETRTASYPSGT
jgi:hypothetical protein